MVTRGSLRLRRATSALVVAVVVSLATNAGAGANLLEAARSNPRLLERLLELGGNPNERPAGIPLLLEATHAGNAETVKILLAHGADPYVELQQGDISANALHWAAIGGHAAVVRAFVAAGVDIPKLAAMGLPASALDLAISFGRFDIVTILIDYGASLEPRDAEGYAPVIRAIVNGDARVVRALLESNAPVGDSSLSFLIQGGPPDWVDLADLLLEHGADVDERGTCSRKEDGQDCTVLSVVAGIDIAESIRHSKESSAAQAGMGQDEKAARDERRARELPERVVLATRWLIERGADLDARTSLGKTPLDIARKAGNERIAAVLEHAAGAPRPESTGEVSRAARKPTDRAYAARYARRVAVTIGINEYRAAPALEAAVGDARRVAAALRRLGFDEVIELHDAEATRSAILRVLRQDLMRKVGAEDLVVVYFAGHGLTETRELGVRRGYILPADAAGNDFGMAISMAELRDLARQIQAKHLYFVMDSCYSGLGFTRGLKRVGEADTYVAKLTSVRAVQMIAAGMEGEEAQERDGQGLFTRYFLRALAGEADQDSDGVVTAGEIGAFVRPRVSKDSEQRQTPMYGSLEGEGDVVFWKKSL